jgi:dTDP-4-dehydrorhamnose reductase
MSFQIIGSGFLGTKLLEQLKSATVFDRSSLFAIPKFCDVIIIAAPTGNRLTVNQNPKQDLEDCISIHNAVEQVSYRKIIYLSTVDVYATKTSKSDQPEPLVPDSSYGANRYLLESKISALPNSAIVRLPSLCHKDIKKNILYDLVNQQWLEKICLDSETQWYPVDQLSNDIEYIIDNNISQINLTTAPISNRVIVEKFCPELMEHLQLNSLQKTQYNVRTCHSDSGYWICDSVIWKNFAEFFRIHRQTSIIQL